MIRRKRTKISSIQIDEMVVNLLQECYGLEYADISSHFYQLANQALETNPNIIGPLKPPTELKITNKLTGRSFNVTKTVDTPQEVSHSIWVVRGFYPKTAIPFKMTIWRGHSHFDGHIGVKILMGSFADRQKMLWIDAVKTEEYIEEVAEKTLLDEPVNEDKKPVHETKLYKCMSPKGLPLQKKTKKNK